LVSEFRNRCWLGPMRSSSDCAVGRPRAKAGETGLRVSTRDGV
jgi:hypothetical protein